jgi:PAS domain S-box-containing protein
MAPTERLKRSKTPSRTSAIWLRRLLKSNVLAMGCWRVGGRFTATNEALLRLIGYTRKEVNTGKVLLRDLTPPQLAFLNAEALKEAQTKGECTPYETELIRKDRSRVPVLIGGATFGDGITDAGAFFMVDLRQRRVGKGVCKEEIRAEVLALTDRQRAICLLLSYGEPEKRIAKLLDLGLRTVELDKHRVAEQLGMPISRVIVWTVENRHCLLASIEDKKLLPEAAAEIISRACH